MDSSKAARVVAVGLVAAAATFLVKQWPKASGVWGIAAVAMLHELLNDPVARYLDGLRPV